MRRIVRCASCRSPRAGGDRKKPTLFSLPQRVRLFGRYVRAQQAGAEVGCSGEPAPNVMAGVMPRIEAVGGSRFSAAITTENARQSVERFPHACDSLSSLPYFFLGSGPAASPKAAHGLAQASTPPSVSGCTWNITRSRQTL